MQRAFDDFVLTLREELRVIDEELSPEVCDESRYHLCERKVGIYERFTSGLIENAAKYLEIIQHLETELKNADSTGDYSSDSSSPLSEADVDKTMQIDLGYLKELLGRKVSEERRALQSLRKLETTLMSLKLENSKLAAERKELEAKVIESQKMTPDVDATGAINIAQLLTHENDQLRKIISRNEFTLNAIGPYHHTKGQLTPNDADCLARVEELQRQLNDKDKLIANLQVSIAKKNETKSKLEEIKSQRNRVHRLVSDESKNINDDSSLSDSESNDNNKLNLLMEGHHQLSALVKEKYTQLRQQRAEIKSLKKKLDEYEKNTLHSNEMVNTQGRNSDWNNESQQHADQTEDHKPQIDMANQREAILARKISLQTDQIRDLLEERTTLIRVNNEILETIAVCKRELAKYQVE